MASEQSKFKDIIRHLRIKYFRKQEAFAVALRLSKAEISLWETGRRRPSPVSMKRIIFALRDDAASKCEIATLIRSWHHARNWKSEGEPWECIISRAPADEPLVIRQHCPR
jgi:hypothetical protein